MVVKKDVAPSFEVFSEWVAEGATVVPVVHELVADGWTPVTAHAALVAKGAPGFLLESVVGGETWARYSFVGFEPALIVRGGQEHFERRAGHAHQGEDGVDPYARLEAELAQWVPPRKEALESLGLPRFWGGAVGYLSYDTVRRFEPSVGPMADGDEFSFAVGATLVVFDALRQTMRVVVPARVQGDVLAAYGEAVGRIERVVKRLSESGPALSKLPMPSGDHDGELPASSFVREDFEAAVLRCQEHIRAGDIFQLVLSQRFEVPVDGAEAFDVYRAMRVVNPSPYMYFLRLPEAEGSVEIAGASPETLVRLEDGIATVRPIAGTRRRGASPAEDDARAEELKADPKEQAEHVMLVDLGRNDIGRISEAGTVEVNEKMVIERYSHVMHMTSNVVGKVRDGFGALDVFRATFPAGTLSGAPKVRAMQLIGELEPEHRGVYGGAVGYLGFDGNMDLAIAIRTVVRREGRFLLQAGAGIVEASKPDFEFEETVNKARAGLVAIDAARRGAR